MTASNLSDPGDLWYTVQNGPHAGQLLMRGSARIQAETDGYTVVAYMKFARRTVPVWQGIDPFTAGDVVEKINVWTPKRESSDDADSPQG